MTPAPRVSPLSDHDQARVNQATTDHVIAQLKAAGLGQPVDEPLSLKSQLVQKLIMIVVACLVAYFTALNTIDQKISDTRSIENGHYQQLNATEQSHFGEVLRRLDAMQSDVRELRGRP